MDKIVSLLSGTFKAFGGSSSLPLEAVGLAIDYRFKREEFPFGDLTIEEVCQQASVLIDDFWKSGEVPGKTLMEIKKGLTLLR